MTDGTALDERDAKYAAQGYVLTADAGAEWCGFASGNLLMFDCLQVESGSVCVLHAEIRFAVGSN